MSARALLLALLAVPLLGGDCGKTPAPPVPQCGKDKPCTGGQVCVEGACGGCRLDNQCALDQFCHPIHRLCEPRPCHGTQCTQHDDCALGEFCVQGLCLKPGVTSAEGCSVESCAAGEPCPEGKRCSETRLVCEEYFGCQSDNDCSADQRCNVAAARCEAACTVETATAICGVKRICSDGRCVDCLVDGDCGGGLRCNADKNVCESLTSCSSSRDCQVPLVCNRLTRQCTVNPGPCLSNEDCAPDETCTLSTGKCAPATCQPDRYAPNATLADAPLVVPGPVPNLTLCAGDVDYLKLALSYGDRVQAVVDVDPLLNFDIALLSATGDVISQAEFAVDGTVARAGDYFLRMQSSDAYVRYGLRITVSRGRPCDPDPEEPNDDSVGSTVLAPGDYYGRSMCPGDQDWYQVAVTAGRKIVVELVSSPLDGQLDVQLLDGDARRVLDQNASSAEVETVSSAAFTGTRVYVRVFGATDWVQNRYDLHVWLRDP